MSNIKLDSYKIYVQDVGLLVSMLDSSIKLNLLNKDLYINEGSIIENVCAMHLSRRKDKLTYFEKKSKLEIDFVLNIDGVVTVSQYLDI